MLGLWELAVPMTKTDLLGNQYLLSLLSHLITDKTTFKYLQGDQKNPYIKNHVLSTDTVCLKEKNPNKQTPKKPHSTSKKPQNTDKYVLTTICCVFLQRII